MAQTWLSLGVLAWVSRCCGAFTVDHFDQQRRLTRVDYNPLVKAPQVSVHYNTPSGRRLDDIDEDGPGSPGYQPNSDRPDVTLMVVNPDELYVHVTDIAVVIYGTDITLNDYMYDAQRDLVVMGGRINLPENMKFASKPELTGELRTIHLQAMEIFAHTAGSTIDVSGDVGSTPDNGLSAAHGIEPGDAGSDGEDGDNGGSGGVVEIEAGSVFGVLNIDVDGGVGGAGQNGGDGAVGTVGERRTDIDDCCQGKKAKGQTGNPGGAGGDAGLGGNGGNGGKSGHVELSIQTPLEEGATNIQEDGTIKDISVSSNPGAAGGPGVTGRAAIGGLGGPGIMTKCRSIDIFWFNRMCTFPIGEAGPHGSEGAAGTAGAPGKMGGIGDSGVSVISEKTLHELRANGAGDNLRYEMFLADKLYRGGNYLEALKLYVWVEAVMHTEHPAPADGAEAPWRQIGLEAAVKVTQLNGGLDFWGHQLNHAPLLSFDALHENIKNLLDIASEAEKAFDKYYEEGTSENERKNLIVKAMKNIDYQISLTESGLYQARQSIEELRTDILQFQVEQDMWTGLVMEHAEACDSAIADKEANANNGLVPTVQKLVKLATNGWALWGTVLGVATVGLGVWGLLAAQVAPVVDSVVNSVSGQSANMAGLQSIIDTSIGNTVPKVQTLVSNTLTSKTDVEDAWGKVTGAIDVIQSDATADQERVNGIRTQTNVAVSLDDFLAIRTEYIDEIEECGPVRDNYNELRIVSENMMNKIMEHDMNVVKFATLSVEKSRFAKERADLLTSVVGTFDPTGLQFMQSIGQAYRGQKDRIVEMLKMAHDAVDFEFCEQNPFQYEDVRVTQLASFLAQVSSDRMRKLYEDTSSRGLLEERSADGQVSAVTKINLMPTMSADLALAFQNFYQNGTLIHNIDVNDPNLPTGVANLRVVNSQVFVPALLLDEFGQNDLAEVWTRKLGSSTCTDPAGNERLFSHAASGYYSVYNAKVDPRLTGASPSWMTQPSHNRAVVGPTPVGTWQVSIPALTTRAEREQVSEIELHLFLSYVPCNEADCGASAQSAATMAFHSKRTKFDKHSLPSASTATALSLFGAAAVGSLLTAAAVFGIDHRRSARRATLASPHTDGTELHPQ